MKGNKGFTLIELLVVIAIIGILSSIVLVSMGNARQQARDARRQADMRQIISAQELYYGNNSVYLATDDWPGTIADINQAYMPVVPVDPTNSGGQVYTWVDNTSDNQRFCAFVQLETKGSCSTSRWYTASEKGNFEVCDKAATDFDLTNCGQ